MKDMNFFAPFQVGSTSKRIKVSYKAMIAGVVVILVATPTILFAYQFLLNTQIAKEEQLLNAPENIKTVSRIETKKQQLGVAQQSISELGKKDLLLASSEVTTEKSMQVILDTLPKQIKLDTLMMMGSDISMQGTAVDRPAIAELAYNIRSSGLVEGLTIPTITKNVGGGFDFSANFKLKAVVAQ